MSAASSLGSAPAFASSLLAALAGATAWLSAGTLAVVSGDAERVAALPSVSLLILAIAGAAAVARLARLQLAEAWPLAISFLIWLPFIPGAIPNAFLLWEGPIEGMVWVVTAAGLLYARNGLVRLRAFGATADPVRAPWIAALAAATFSLFAFNQVRAVVPNGDEPHYLAATQSLIGDRDLKVENNYARGDYLEYFDGRLQPHFLRRSAAGEIYSIHSPGVSLIVLPAFLIAGYAGAVLTVIVIAGLAAALTWMVAWRLTQSVAAAWVGLAAVFATAPFLFHTFTIYPDGIGALMVMSGVWLIARLLDDEVPGQRHLAAAGAALAVLPWLHTRFAVLSVALGLIIVALLGLPRRSLSEGGPTRLAAFLAVPAIAAAAWFAYFWIIWGTPSPLAPYGRDTESSVSYVGRGLAGLTLDQQFGVLTTAPVYVIGVAGMVGLARQRLKLAMALLFVTIPYVVAVSTYAMWWGGTSAPARFVGALLPLAALPIAYAWEKYPRLRIATLLLLLGSIALMVPRLTEDGGRLAFASRNIVDGTAEWLSQHVALAFALPSVHRDGPSKALADAALWLFAILVMCGASVAAARRRCSRGAAWALVAVAGAAMVTLSGILLLNAASSVTSRRSVLAALHRQRPWHQTFVEISSLRPLSPQEFLGLMAFDVEASREIATLRLARVPAGDYELIASNGSPGANVAVNINRSDPLLESAAMPFQLQLPVAASSLSVRAEPVAGMRFRPLRVQRPINADRRQAIRAARYGRARVFFFDERAYPEPRGFWTRGEGRATLVIDADDAARQSGLPLTFTGGAAATTIGISVGEWSQSYSLTPGQRREITLPPLTGARAWVVDIHSGPGFRPFEREPGNTDVRLLAAWFEIP